MALYLEIDVFFREQWVVNKNREIILAFIHLKFYILQLNALKVDQVCMVLLLFYEIDKKINCLIIYI